MNCICDSPKNQLKNVHSNKLDVNMFLLSDSDGYGIIVMNKFEVMACFEIDYCPKCGKKLA